MIAVKPSQLRENLKEYCDMVVDGEIIILSRPSNENVVIVSEKEFNVILKKARMAGYHEYFDMRIKDVENGEIKS